MELFGGISRLFDPAALILVLGGAFAIAALRSTRADLAGALGALVPLFRADPAADAHAARAALGRIRRIAEARSIACADRVQTVAPFLRLAALRVSEAERAEEFAAWAEDEITGLEARHARVAAVWHAVADAAPGAGMLGTIVGLTGMFAHMDDGGSIGPPMALALLTTFYGIFLSTVVAGPIASRLERLAREEVEWKRWTCRALGRLLAVEEGAALVTPSAPPRARLRGAA